MKHYTVVCIRCRIWLAAHQADISADGMLCRKCTISSEVAERLGGALDDPEALASAERGLALSKSLKQVLVGAAGLLLGIPILIFMLWAASAGVMSRGIVLPGVLIIAGALELIRGLNGISSLPTRNRP